MSITVKQSFLLEKQADTVAGQSMTESETEGALGGGSHVSSGERTYCTAHVAKGKVGLRGIKSGLVSRTEHRLKSQHPSQL